MIIRTHATARRRKNQKGQEIIEFGLVAIMLVGTFMGSFITGMNLIRSNQANQACRDLDDMYIHGADFSTYAMQQMAQRLAGGLNLQIGSSFTGQRATNTGNNGNVLVTVSQIMWVGSTTDPNCTAVGASNCTNHDSFVFTQRVQFGNGTLTSQSPSSLGDPGSGATISTAGIVQTPVTNSAARLPNPQQGTMQSLWQGSSSGTTPLQDGQVCYVMELYAQSPDLSLGSFPGQGVYARYFF